MFHARRVLCAVLLLYGSLSAAEKPDPRVEAILKDWKKKLHSMQTYHLKGSVIEYDSVFEVERHADLEVGFERTGRRIARWTVPKIDPDLKSKRRGRSGEPYGIETSFSDLWYFPPDHKTIQYITGFQENLTEDEAKKSIGREKILLFSPHLLWSIGLLSSSIVEDEIDHFEWSIVSENEKTLTLQGIPKTYVNAANIRRLIIELSANDHAILAIKLTYPSGNLETELKIKEFQFDQPFEKETTMFDLPDGGFRQVIAIPPENRDKF